MSLLWNPAQPILSFELKLSNLLRSFKAIFSKSKQFKEKKLQESLFRPQKPRPAKISERRKLYIAPISA